MEMLGTEEPDIDPFRTDHQTSHRNNSSSNMNDDQMVHLGQLSGRRESFAMTQLSSGVHL